MKLNKKYWPPQVVIFNEKMVARNGQDSVDWFSGVINRSVC